MYAQCPECLTLYELDAATLAQAHGTVGCGQCGATFSALATLTERLPEAPFESLAVHPASPAPPILMMATVLPAAVTAPADSAANDAADGPEASEPMAGSEVAATTSDHSDTPPTTDAIPDASDMEAEESSEATTASDALSDFLRYMQAPPDAAQDTPEATAIAMPSDGTDDGNDDDEDEGEDDAFSVPPSFVHRPRTPAAPLHKRRWIVGCLILALCLCAQLAFSERQRLAANASTRPWLTKVCGWLDCTVPTVRDLAGLQLLSRDVRPHPSVPGALLISATVRNNAAFAQPYPVVSITLSDLDENRIAMRRFRPSTYMPDADARAAGLAPGATTALMFEVEDPGRNAIAFQFAFQ